MNYQKPIQKVMTFIEEHLDEELSLKQLSDIACLSKFHFHRLFGAYTGMSLLQFTRWLRLKRAAHQLVIDKDQTILNIAIDAGFESHEAFSRVFKKTCGLSPKEFRQGFHLHLWEQPPYRLPEKGVIKMNVEIKSQEAIRLAVIEHRGDPKLVANSIDKLINWAKAQPGNLKPNAGEAFAIAYDDPKATPAKEFRLDLGIKIPANLKLSGEIIEKVLPAGRYATAMHKGSRDNIGETVYGLYRDWLPNTDEKLGDLPCVFCYHNFEHEVAETALLTECRLLLA
jgi:AraC family transcriptional regulator